MKAILSDIHGNFEALQAVLEDATRHGVQAIYCLGDLVGYGPNPRECVDLAMQWDVVLLGFHDLAVQHDPPSVGLAMLIANRSLAWSRTELNAPVPDPKAAARRWQFLAGRPRRHQEDDFLFVHASPRERPWEYIMPEEVRNHAKMAQVFAAVGRYCLAGHTHRPGVFTENLQFRSPAEVGYTYRFGEGKALCNVGSVGRPGDGDWRACYALLDGDTVRFRRVEYDIGTTVRKIHEADGLDKCLAELLQDGW